MDTPRQLALDLAANLRARALYQGRTRVGDAPPAPVSRRVEPTVAGARFPIPLTGSEGGQSSAKGLYSSLSWEALEEKAQACRDCGLCETRTQVVFGEGARDADLMFVGEAPGRDEDEQGRPFVGRSGKLLTQMIEAMGLSREQVFIANVLKCRPPANRDPAADEVKQCRPYLLRQIEVITPKIICTLGRHALRTLTDYEGPIGKVRGRPMEFAGTTVIPTFHPAYLLRNPSAKRDAWEDLKTVLRMLGRPVPRVSTKRP